jgi:hypothetical protein
MLRLVLWLWVIDMSDTTTVEVACPDCGKAFHVPPGKLGKQAGCPCGRRFKLETPADEPADEDGMYDLADDLDDIPALSALAAGDSMLKPVEPPPMPVGGAVAMPTPAAAVAKRRKAAVAEPAGGSVMLGLLFALVGAALGALLWIGFRWFAGWQVGILFVCVTGYLAGVGSIVGAKRGGVGLAIGAAAFTLLGAVAAKAGILAFVVWPSIDALVGQDFPPEPEDEFAFVDPLAELTPMQRAAHSGAEELVLEEMGLSRQAYNETSRYDDEVADKTMAKVRAMTDAELAEAVRRQQIVDDRFALVQKLIEERHPNLDLFSPAADSQVSNIREEVEAMSDAEVTAAMAGDRREQQVEELAQALATIEAGPAPSGFDSDEEWAEWSETRDAALGDARAEANALADDELPIALIEAEATAAEEANVFDATIDDIDLAAKRVQSAWTHTFSCSDPVVLLLGMGLAFGVAYVGKLR